MYYKYENIKHIDGLPLRVFCVSLRERLVHWHRELEILFILKGSVDITLGDRTYTLKEKDVFLINAYDVHGFKESSDDNIVLALQIDMKYARHLHKNIDKMKFDVQFLSENTKIIHVIKYFLANMLIALKSEKESRNLLVMGMLNFLVSYLIEDFKVTLNESAQSSLYNADRKRIIHIINYINDHYTEKISLQNLADEEHLSKYYLSHFITEKLGMSFQELVNELRLEKAIKLLSRTEMKILDVSIACGFSDAKYLNRLIRDKYDCSAKGFRQSLDKSKQTIRYDLVGDNYQHMPFDFKEALSYIEKYAKNMWSKDDIVDDEHIDKVSL